MSLNADQNKYRKAVSARDIAERLLVNFDVNELLLWPPNLFAFTSSVLSLTSAYQLVISPPRGMRWPPAREEVSDWLPHLTDSADAWLKEIDALWRGEKDASDLEPSLADENDLARFHKEIKDFKLQDNSNNWWCGFVRDAGTQWASRLANLDESVFDLIHGGNITSDDEPHRATVLFESLLATTPIAVLATWLTLYPLLLPSEQTSISKLLCNADNCDPDEVIKYWQYAQALITLHAIADEACVVWGIQQEGDKKAKLEFGGKARGFADVMLLRDGTMATIGSERCRVLPKRHNPNVGITLRSLSSNLAFHRSSIDVVWRQAKGNPLSQDLDMGMKLTSCADRSSGSSFTISLLLLPWPMQIHASDFKDYRTQKQMRPADFLPVELDESRYGFFVYSPDKSDFSPQHVIDLVEAAEEEGEPVSMLVMPESAITSTDMASVEVELAKRKKKDTPPVSVLIAGVRDEPKGATFARNAVYCRTIRKERIRLMTQFTYEDESQTARVAVADRTKQYKHHRWKMDAGQIKQYGLSSVLDPQRQWWEAIKVERRRVSFVNLGNRLTICPLICEDLARQDPIADLIRHVGPNLVVTILMDGPQKADRWASRYAGVLAEDPGSAVIALSSYGMVRRWSTPYRQLSNVVALWNDGKSPAREIELAQGAEGILLRLKVESECEPIADGRIEMFATANISLADVIQVYRSH